jgi:predicted site-specific integrase-resolvase
VRDLQRELIGLTEASKIVGVTPVTLKTWALTGKHGLRFSRIPNGHMLLNRADVLRIAKDRDADR